MSAGPNMTVDQARAIVREPVVVGGRFTFYSTMAGQDAGGRWPALYSGRPCDVLGPVADVDEESEPMFRVRFDNGDELEVFQGELDGWYFDSGQWHGPFAAVLEPDFPGVREEVNR